MRYRLLLVSLCLCVRAQQTGQQHLKFSGTVLDGVTGAAVSAADVLFSDNKGGNMHTTTGSDGRFDFGEGTVGNYFLRVSHSGYAEIWQAVQLSSGSPAVVVKINPFSRISGHVIDEEGQPVESLNVQALTRTIQNGREFWQPGMSSETDAQGHYSLDLQGGVYLIEMLQAPLYPAARPTSEASRYIYPETFSPSASDRESAQRISAMPGTEATADIVVKSVRGVRVSVVADAPHFQASIGKENGRFFNPQMLAGEDGAVHFAAVPPGDWVIYAGSYDTPPNEKSGSMPIHVGTNDISAVRVSLFALANIPVVVQNGQKTSHVDLQLISQDDLWSAFPQIQPDGSQAFLSVPPGNFQAVPMAGPSCIASLASGGANLSQNLLVVSAGAAPPPILVSLADKCPSLNLSTKSGETALVVVVGSNGALPQPLFIGGSSGSKASLSPGRYRFYAFQDVTGIAYADPQVLRAFEGQDVEVTNDNTQSVILDVVNKVKP